MLASAESGLSTEMASNGKLVGGHDDKPWDFGGGRKIENVPTNPYSKC